MIDTITTSVILSSCEQTGRRNEITKELGALQIVTRLPYIENAIERAILNNHAYQARNGSVRIPITMRSGGKSFEKKCFSSMAILANDVVLLTNGLYNLTTFSTMDGKLAYGVQVGSGLQSAKVNGSKRHASTSQKDTKSFVLIVIG